MIRRIKHDGGERDEMFWHGLHVGTLPPLLYSSERGDLTNDMVPISEDEAERIVSRIRADIRRGVTDWSGRL